MELKHTGIIRRIDDLGRIEFPAELRKELGVEEDDCLELSVAEIGGKKLFSAIPYIPAEERLMETAAKIGIRLRDIYGGQRGLALTNRARVIYNNNFSKQTEEYLHDNLGHTVAQAEKNSDLKDLVKEIETSDGVRIYVAPLMLGQDIVGLCFIECTSLMKKAVALTKKNIAGTISLINELL